MHEGWYPLQRPSSDEKTPDSRNCLLREPMENRRVRSNGFRVTRLTSLRCVPVRLMSLSQVFYRKAKLKFSSPSWTAQRPFQGRWLVLMDPNWFQQSHLAAIHRRRTAASGTNEFQIRQNSQLQHEYPPLLSPELIGHRKMPLRDTRGRFAS